MSDCNFKVGDSVRIIDGWMEGAKGVIAKVPNEDDYIHFTVLTEDFQSAGVWAVESELERIDENYSWMLDEADWTHVVPIGYDPYDFMAHMLQINITYNRDKCIRRRRFVVNIFPSDRVECKIPHCHVSYVDYKNRKMTSAYVRLDRAGYVNYRKNKSKHLNPNEANDLDKFFRSHMEDHVAILQGSGLLVENPTSWQYAVYGWLNDKTETKLEKYFQLDERGDPIMPNYRELE